MIPLIAETGSKTRSLLVATKKPPPLRTNELIKPLYQVPSVSPETAHRYACFSHHTLKIPEKYGEAISDTQRKNTTDNAYYRNI